MSSSGFSGRGGDRSIDWNTVSLNARVRDLSDGGVGPGDVSIEVDFRRSLEGYACSDSSGTDLFELAMEWNTV